MAKRHTIRVKVCGDAGSGKSTLIDLFKYILDTRGIKYTDLSVGDKNIPLIQETAVRLRNRLDNLKDNIEIEIEEVQTTRESL